MSGLAATLGSNHVCPMCNGTVPHVGGPVAQGETTVLIEGKPAATVGSMCVCVGPPDTVVTGVSSVLIGGKPAATVGSLTAHGGTIIAGSGSVLIGTGASAPTAVMSIAEIPFPKVKLRDVLGAKATGNAEKLKGAQKTQQQIKNLAESNQGEPKVYNLRWVKDQKIIRDERELKQVTLMADVLNIDDGKTATITIKKPEGDKEQEVTTLTATVKNKKAVFTWVVEEDQSQTKEKHK